MGVTASQVQLRSVSQTDQICARVSSPHPLRMCIQKPEQQSRAAWRLSMSTFLSSAYKALLGCRLGLHTGSNAQTFA